jgi:ABC-type polysaccharide/polyol phosphate export permease
MWHSLGRLLQHRLLIRTLVQRELKARYRGSVLGFLWTFVHPLMLLAVYTFVFTYVIDPFRGEGAEPYALFLFCGLLPWTWFSAGLAESANSLLMGGNLIKKIIFPAEVLPVVSVVHNGVNFILGLPIYFVFWIWFRPESISLHLLWLPLVILVQALFMLGLGFFLAALTVHYRDVKDLLANILTLWFFGSPVIYSYTFLAETKPGSLGTRLLELNPMTHIIEAYHTSMFTGELLHWRRFGVTGIVALLTFVLGYYFFDRLRDSFAEEV